MASRKSTKKNALKIAGFFAGIGGIEIGLHKAGHETQFLCEIDPEARAVLSKWYAKKGIPLGTEIPFEKDIVKAAKRRLPQGIDLVAGGFPCQDLSQAGRTAGISGSRSGLVESMLSMVERLPKKRRPGWILLENVAFMLRLDRGAAMDYLVSRIEELGYSWAYRLVDTRSFGLPQRRQRVILLAGRDDDPKEVLFSGIDADPLPEQSEGKAVGFYWTEGTRGLGWAPNCIPTLKGGSGVGIPSPPAIWLPDGRFVTPNLQSAERLQGFEAGHTAPARELNRRKGERSRWRLLGNAVSLNVAKWVGKQLRTPGEFDRELKPIDDKWPFAAAGGPGLERMQVQATLFPADQGLPDLEEFLYRRGKLQVDELSPRALRGFYGRYTSDQSNLVYRESFDRAMRRWLKRPEVREINEGWIIPTPSKVRKNRGVRGNHGKTASQAR